MRGGGGTERVKWILPAFKPFPFLAFLQLQVFNQSFLAWHDAIVRKAGPPQAAPSMPQEMPVLPSPSSSFLLTSPLEGKECISTSSLRKNNW